MYSKIIVFFLLIFLGVVLKKKFDGKSERFGIKSFILNISLPATIFISFISIQLNPDFIILPIIGILFNFFILLLSPFVLKLTGLHNDYKKSRTLLLLLPSFAPGISCFPIIEEFLGSEYLVKASFLDFGNKLFVLVFLLGLSFHLHRSTQGIKKRKNKISIKSILKNIFLEPINAVLAISIIMLSFGFNINDIPAIITDFISRLKDTLTPLVLIFVGLSIIFAKQALREIIPLLFIRAGISLFLIGLIGTFTDFGGVDDSTFYVILSLSSVSFWPFAHMTLIDKIEKNAKFKERTFDIQFGLNFLAYSLPFSTIFILLFLSNSEKLVNVSSLFMLALIMIVVGFLIMWMSSKPIQDKKVNLGEGKKNSFIYFFKSFL